MPNCTKILFNSEQGTCTAYIVHLLWAETYAHTYTYRACMSADIYNQENELCVFYKHTYCRSTDAIHCKLIFIYVRIVVVPFLRVRASILFSSLVEMLFVVSNAKMIRSRLKMMALKTEKVNRILNWHRTNFTFFMFSFSIISRLTVFECVQQFHRFKSQRLFDWLLNVVPNSLSIYFHLLSSDESNYCSQCTKSDSIFDGCNGKTNFLCSRMQRLNIKLVAFEVIKNAFTFVLGFFVWILSVFIFHLNSY